MHRLLPALLLVLLMAAPASATTMVDRFLPDGVSSGFAPDNIAMSFTPPPASPEV